jgi:hypothetical protein
MPLEQTQDAIARRSAAGTIAAIGLCLAQPRYSSRPMRTATAIRLKALPVLALTCSLLLACGGTPSTPTGPTPPTPSPTPVPGPTAPLVTADSVTPSSGSGATQTFAFRYSHSYGAAELRDVHVNFKESLNSTATNTCPVYYDRSANTLFLATDGLSDWRSATLGTAETLQNSQCAIAVGSSSVTLAGNTLTLYLAMRFKPAFAGRKHIYMYAFAGTPASSGWEERGEWTVPGPTAPLVTAEQNCHRAEQSARDCGGKHLGSAPPQHRAQPLLLHAFSGDSA